MDRFNAMPLPARVLTVFLVMALIAGGFYFFLVSDLQDGIARQQRALKDAEAEAQQLAQYDSAAQLEAIEEEEAELRARIEKNKQLLPEQDKIPKLIADIKRQADERGLKINKFVKKDRRLDDYVALIPVRMEVEGSFPVLISFFDALAQPNMRMMTVTDLELRTIPIERFMSRRPKVTRRQRRSGPEEARRAAMADLIERLDLYAEALTRAVIDAKFTVNAYSYTGQLLSAKERAKRAKRRRRRH